MSKEGMVEEKPTVVVVTRDCREQVFAGQPGMSVMEVIREGGCEEVLAVCGGCCSCATCHVYVDPAFAGLLPPWSKEEAELLQSLSKRTPRSRLSCQITFTADLTGLRVTVAPEE
jgi:2Fe-2S ferredoxin